MFAESVHCQIGVAKGNRKVIPTSMHVDRLLQMICTQWRYARNVMWNISPYWRLLWHLSRMRHDLFQLSFA